MFISYYIYQSLHVLGDYVSIIRRNNCIYATLGTCYSVWITVWYAFHSIPDSHPYRITSTKCRQKYKEINILKKLCTKLALFTRLYRDAQSTKYKIHGVKKVGIIGGCRELHSEKLHDCAPWSRVLPMKPAFSQLAIQLDKSSSHPPNKFLE